MVSSLEQITADALTLTREEREQLVDRLLESIGGAEDLPISAEWMAEIERRVQEIDDGMETIPAEEVFAKLRAELRQKDA